MIGGGRDDLDRLEQAGGALGLVGFGGGQGGGGCWRVASLLYLPVLQLFVDFFLHFGRDSVENILRRGLSTRTTVGTLKIL